MRPGRLLVDLPNWVGDVVMALPAVARLVEANAGGVTVLHARPPVERLLLELFPGVTTLTTRRGASPFLVARRLLPGGGRFHVGVTLRHATRAKLVLRLVARRRLGSGTGAGRLLLTDPVAVDRDRHQVHDADPILGRLGLPPADPGWRPSLPAGLLEEGGKALARLVPPGVRVVGLAPSAAWGESKRWPAERFGRLARTLAERGLHPVLLVGPGEEPVAAEVRAAAGMDLAVAGPSLDIAGFLGLMARLDAVVSNDSGPMHLAALAGCPVVGLFGPTDPRRTAPLGSRSVVVSRGLECAPCFEPVCPLGTRACLAGIGVDEVCARVLALVDG